MKINLIMKSHYFLFLIVTLFLQGCNEKREQCAETDFVVIPDSLYLFFPKKDSLWLKLYSISTNAEVGSRSGESLSFLESHFYKLYSCENVALFNDIINSYKQEAIDSLRPTDDNYFIIKYEYEMRKIYDYKTLREKYQESINKYILPSFHDEIKSLFGNDYSFATVCGLPEDYEVLIMKSGGNYVLPNNNTWKFDWHLLPQELKHGYTSGIAYRNTSDKIIYWSIAW